MLLGLNLAADSLGNLHLVYWSTPDYGTTKILSHRIHDGSAWSFGTDLDTAASSPDLIALPNGSLYLAWERQTADRVVPMLRAYNGSWQAEQVLPSDTSANAWYPKLTYDPDVESLLVTWSERSGAASRLALASVPVSCLPSCGNCTCGGDGCGGSCGTRDDPQTCNSSGQCQALASCTDGIQNQGETGVDCGGPCSACPTNPCTCPRGCNALVNVSIPFVRDGSNHGCYYFAQSAGSYIDSWNVEAVNLNGVEIANRYMSSNAYPAAAGAGYYLYVRSSLPRGHVEVRNQIGLERLSTFLFVWVTR